MGATGTVPKRESNGRAVRRRQRRRSLGRRPPRHRARLVACCSWMKDHDWNALLIALLHGMIARCTLLSECPSAALLEADSP